MKTLNQIIHQLALQEPDRQALYSWDGALTYEELDHYSSILAFHLRERQVSSGILVPVCFAKSMWAIVAMLAINKAGGAFVPLDPSYPQSRLKAILLQLNSPVGLVSKDQSRLLEGLIDSTLVVSEETFSELPVNDAGFNLLPDMVPKPLAIAYSHPEALESPRAAWLVSQRLRASQNTVIHCI